MSNKKIKLTDDDLYKLYWMENLNCRQIAEICNVASEATIRHYFYKHNIPLRNKSDAFKLSQNDGRFKNNCIPWNKGLKNQQTAWNKTELDISKDELINLYQKNKKSINEIAELYNTTQRIISRIMDEYNIEKRSIKESSIIRSNYNLSWRKNISITLKGRPSWNKDKKRTWYSPSEFKKGHKLSNETILKIRQSLKNSPNKPEKKLIEIISKFKLPFKFTGNGTYIINGLNPDFVNINEDKKEVIEVFGEYWHRNRKNIPYNQTEDGRNNIFSKLGYKTLFLWVEEDIYRLSDIEIVKKIINFFNLSGDNYVY